jgi:hypothetical protein
MNCRVCLAQQGHMQQGQGTQNARLVQLEDHLQLVPFRVQFVLRLQYPVAMEAVKIV